MQDLFVLALILPPLALPTPFLNISPTFCAKRFANNSALHQDEEMKMKDVEDESSDKIIWRACFLLGATNA